MNKNRWFIGFLMFLGVAIYYLDRVNISHAILLIANDLGLTKTEQGVVMSMFSFGYVAFMFLGGIVITKFGVKWTIVWTTLLLSLTTILCGCVNNYIQLMIVRFFVGVFEAPIFPANAKVVATEFKANEKGRATAFFDSGSYIGASLAAPFVIYLILNLGWRSVFYLSGFIGILWCILWLSTYSSIVKKEEKPKHNYLFILKLLSKNQTVLLVSLGFFCYNYLKSFYLTWFPSFLIQEKGFSFIKTGMIAMIPPIFAILGEYVTGYLMDRLQSQGYNIKIYRIFPLCLGLLGSSIIILALSFDNPIIVTIIFTLSYMFLISASPAIWAIPSDISPNREWVSIIGGYQNTFSNVAGIVAPIVTGLLLDVTKSFYIPIIFSAIISIVGALLYLKAANSLKPLIIKNG
jgi:MFS transporter, ACS family, D-galactonate transporter